MMLMFVSSLVLSHSLALSALSALSTSSAAIPAAAEPWQLVTLALSETEGLGFSAIKRRAHTLGFSCDSHRDALTVLLALQQAAAIMAAGGRSGPGGTEMEWGVTWGQALWTIVRLRVRCVLTSPLKRRSGSSRAAEASVLFDPFVSCH